MKPRLLLAPVAPAAQLAAVAPLALIVLILLVPLTTSSAAHAGQWIAPDWPAGGEPKFAPVPLYWFRIVRCPLIYRTVVDVPAGVDRASALLRSSGYVYVCVDGKQVYAWSPQKDSAENPRIAGEPDRVHQVDLGEHLAPGKHVLTVSAPAGGKGQGGFILDGGLYEGIRWVAPLVSDASWTVTAFRPTEVLEDHPIMTLRYDGKAQEGICTAAAKVRAIGEGWTASQDALAAAYFAARVKRLQRDLADATWRLELLAHRGLYVVGGAAHGWAGPNRAPIAPGANAAVGILAKTAALAKRLAKLSSQAVDGAQRLGEVVREVAGLGGEIAAAVSEAASAAQAALKADEDKAVDLAFRDPRLSIISPGTTEVRRRAAEALLRHPLPRLNGSRYDRLGWLPHPGLADSDLSRWGIRVNPVTGPTRIRLGHRWRFSTDPKDTGLNELRHTVGYNIENQWPQIDGQQSWTADKRFADYKGTAWYRQMVFMPAEWAGNEVLLHIRIAGKARVWVNDQELPAPASSAGDDKPWVLPAGTVTFGADNCTAIRVVAEGSARGLTVPAEVSCPALERPDGKATPPVDLLATPLSPCMVLTPRTDALHLHHAGKAELLLPDGSAARDAYDSRKDGRLAANWVLLWLMPQTRTAVERPILLVFQENPSAIQCAAGLTRIKLAAAGGRVIAVRPWAKATPDKAAGLWRKAADLWSRAALAVPINYMTLTTVLKKGQGWQDISVEKVPAGPIIHQAVIYDYLITEDAWKTPPVKLAPLPALCSLAIDARFRGLNLDLPQGREPAVVQDGGIAGPYRALEGTDRVAYSYPIEPWPRLIGFTSWMFSWADAGVPGNQREMELIAATGANSYRPQHNWSDQLAGNLDKEGRWVGHYPQSEKRTRVQITADFCRDAGINYMNNIDQTLGPYHDMVRNDYARWVSTVLYPHYGRLVPQLADRPFWQVAYDLVNEPFDHKAAAYNPTMKDLTRRIRAVDKRHLLYIEPCQAWGAIQQLRLIEPTGDPLTVYSFHDYNFRMNKPDDRWPTLERDITTICQMWWPAFEFAVRHGVPMHCGEFGGFSSATNDALCQRTLLNDFLRLFDQFGMHHHYYSGREIYARQADGSLRPSNVVRAYRDYTRRGDLNAYYKLWPEHPHGS